jgi:hypothetical protein
VLNFVYGWNADSKSYLTVDVLESGEGFWMYAFDTCMLWVTGNWSDDVVTNLALKWNLVGLPFDETIGEENLTVVLLNSSSYTWSEAVVNGYVLDFVYGWNASSKSYMIMDELETGGGYWMYAYDNCLIKK